MRRRLTPLATAHPSIVSIAKKPKPPNSRLPGSERKEIAIIGYLDQLQNSFIINKTDLQCNIHEHRLFLIISTLHLL